MMNDIRYAFRSLLRTPGFTLAAALTLALGIGVTTAMFSVVHAVLLRPLPYADSDRLVMIYATSRFGNGDLSPGDFLDYRRQARSFDGLASIASAPLSLTGDGDPEQVRVQGVSGNFFTLLGIRPIAGRTFVPADDQPGAPEQAVLSETLWKNRYGGRPEIIGRRITLADRTVEVVGVVPASFHFEAPAEVWLLADRGVPRALANMSTSRDIHILTVFGRLRRDVSLASAQGELDAIAANLARTYPQWNTGWGIRLESLQAAIVGDTRPVLLVLLGSVVFLLAIASVNVANLLLVRMEVRRGELATRIALGASPRRLVGQVFVESLVLSSLGGLIGIALAGAVLPMLTRLAPSDLARVDEIAVNWRLFAYAIAISAATGMVLSLWPARRILRGSLVGAINASARGSIGGDHQRTQQMLVAGELAIALVLLIGAGLLVTSLTKLLNVNLGFNPAHIVVADVSLPSERYGKDPGRKARFHDAVLARLHAEHGVQAAMALRAPLAQGINRGVWIDGQPDPAPGQLQTMSFQAISEDYFSVLGVRMVAGRSFTTNDDSRAERVVVVNEAFVRKYLGGTTPIGHRIGFGNREQSEFWKTVVGVVADTRGRPSTAPVATAYIPYRQDSEPWNSGSYIVKSDLPSNSVGETIRRAVLTADPNQPISRVRTLEEAMSTSIALQRFTTLLASFFAGLALVLAAVGIFGVMSYVVSKRTREIGVRLALGAQSRDIVGLIVGQAMRVTAVGAGAGLLLAAIFGQALRTLLFEVAPNDMTTSGTAALALVCTALTASYLPVRRLLRHNPLQNLHRD